jgi:hypothetical protein
MIRRIFVIVEAAKSFLNAVVAEWHAAAILINTPAWNPELQARKKKKSPEASRRMVCRAKQYYYNDAAIREQARTDPNSSPELQAKNCNKQYAIFCGEWIDGVRWSACVAPSSPSRWSSLRGREERKRHAALRAAASAARRKPSFAAHRQRETTTSATVGWRDGFLVAAVGWRM